MIGHPFIILRQYVLDVHGMGVFTYIHLHPKLPSFVGQPTIHLSNDPQKIHSGQSYFFGEYAIGKLGEICLSVMVFETNYDWKIIFLLGRPYFQGLCKKTFREYTQED